jgi:hypothetical protein
MTLVQKFFLRLFPRRADEMEAESRSWMVRCPCGYEQSIWELGGVRWKAAGRPRKYRTCPECGQASWHTVYRKPQ